MSLQPRLADVRCSKIRFQPGDRLLVRTNYRLDEEAKNKLKKTIIKWAGCELEILIYSILDMEIEVEQR